MRHNIRLILFGIVGQSPYAGVAWQALHYLEGFRRLGCDVYYVEDTGTWPCHLGSQGCTDYRETISYLASLMAWCGCTDRWAYRAEAEEGRIYGLAQGELSSLFKSADVLVNLTGTTVLREEHMRIPVRIYLETDPVQVQIQVAQGHPRTIELLSTHTHHFTFGENLGAPDCGAPVRRFDYRPTRQPVVCDWWKDETKPLLDAPFTTIANWCQTGKDIEWNGEVYRWSKHHEFLKCMDLPGLIRQPLELTLACGDQDAIRRLNGHGWSVRNAMTLSGDFLAYRQYIERSRGEFTVAKDQNIRLRSGWFSDRSACYLAAGRPVITQDTGFGNILPVGSGLFSFRTVEDIVEAFDQIHEDYDTHSQAARDIASEYFSAEHVLGSLLHRIGS
jgi:hypothetical protein